MLLFLISLVLYIYIYIYWVEEINRERGQMEFLNKKMVVVIWLGVVWFVVICKTTTLINAELERIEQPAAKGDGSLSFLVIGDWGRRGAFNQSLVALQVLHFYSFLFMNHLLLVSVFVIRMYPVQFSYMGPLLLLGL